MKKDPMIDELKEGLSRMTRDETEALLKSMGVSFSKTPTKHSVKASASSRKVAARLPRRPKHLRAKFKTGIIVPTVVVRKKVSLKGHNIVNNQMQKAEQ